MTKKEIVTFVAFDGKEFYDENECKKYEEAIVNQAKAKDGVIFYIENTYDEFHTRIRGYFKTFEDALQSLAKCSDWYRDKGTGRIYMMELGLDKHPFLMHKA